MKDIPTLAGSIPELKTNCTVFQIHSFGEEIDTDGSLANEREREEGEPDRSNQRYRT